MRYQSEDFQEKKKREKTKLTLRILVAFYILYLAGKVVEASVRHTDALPLLVTVLVSFIFALSSVIFGIYAWREYKKSLAETAGEDEAMRSEKEETEVPSRMDRK